MDDLSLYNMSLHSMINLQFGISIMRVPGGWIYDCWDTENDQFKTGIFIPYNNEFDIHTNIPNNF